MASQQKRVNHYTLALVTGTPVQLSSVLGGAPDNFLRFLSIQAEAANAAVAYIGGGNADVAAANHGFRIEAPTGGVPDAPVVLENLAPGSVKLSDLWALGTTGDALQLFVITDI